MALNWSPAVKRYQARYWATMAVYAALLVSVIWTFSHHPPAGPIRYALAVLPAIPILWVIVIMGRYLLEERDEFLRATLIQSMLWGLAFVLAATTVWGFLEVMVGAPHIALYWVFPLFCLGMGVSQPFIYWRYR